MSQNINLYDPRLERQRDWLALHYVVGVALVLCVAMAAAGWVARAPLSELNTQASAGETQLKTLREQLAVLGQQAANRKPSPQLEQAIVAEQALLGLRGEILATLRQSLGPEAESFAAYLRGLASQTVAGLWLTGFTVNAVSGAMEIRGLTLDPALLPEYIRRLNKEAAFRGRAFAALKLDVKKPDVPASAPAASALAQLPVHHEFMLIPAKETGMDAAGKATLANAPGGAG